MGSLQHNKTPVILRSERLILRLVDPNSDADVQKVVNLYNAHNAKNGGNSQTSKENLDTIRAKLRVYSPMAEFCTRAPPPYSSFLLLHLPGEDGRAEGDHVRGSAGLD